MVPIKGTNKDILNLGRKSGLAHCSRKQERLINM